MWLHVSITHSLNFQPYSNPSFLSTLTPFHIVPHSTITKKQARVFQLAEAIIARKMAGKSVNLKTLGKVRYALVGFTIKSGCVLKFYWKCEKISKHKNRFFWYHSRPSTHLVVNAFLPGWTCWFLQARFALNANHVRTIQCKICAHDMWWWRLHVFDPNPFLSENYVLLDRSLKS